MTKNVWGKDLGAGGFFAGTLLNSGACSKLEEVSEIIGRSFHLVVEEVLVPFQMRGSIGGVHLTRLGELSLFFSPPKALIHINSVDLVLHGVRKENANVKEQNWKLLLAEPQSRSSNGEIQYLDSYEEPQIEFRLL